MFDNKDYLMNTVIDLYNIISFKTINNITMFYDHNNKFVFGLEVNRLDNIIIFHTDLGPFKEFKDIDSCMLEILHYRGYYDERYLSH